MGGKLEAPSAAQHEIEDNGSVVDLLGVEMSVPPQTPGMLWIIAFGRGGEEGEIPILSNVPVKRIKRIEEDEEEPGIGALISELRGFYGAPTTGGRDLLDSCQYC